jgi:polyisoprenoid-binding protein YceI
MNHLKFAILLGVGVLFHIWTATTAIAEPLQMDFKMSEIKVEVRTTISSFTARFEKFDADIECREDANLPEAATVSFDLKDLKTGISLRDEHMLAWLHYPMNTNATFRLTGWKQQNTGCVATGELTFHGIKQTIEMPISITHDHDEYEIDGRASLDYRKFGLPVIRKALFVTVNPHLTVAFHLVGKLNPAKSRKPINSI